MCPVIHSKRGLVLLVNFSNPFGKKIFSMQWDEITNIPGSCMQCWNHQFCHKSIRTETHSENEILEVGNIAHYVISCTYLKFCINCANASVLPARGTIMLMIDLKISTVSLFTFMRGPNGRNKVTCLYSVPSIFLQNSSYCVPLSLSVRQ